jgi:hypothetical protein
MEGPVKLKSREAHLKEGIKPIMVWVGVEDDFKQVLESTPKFGLKDLHHLDWFEGSYYPFYKEDFIKKHKEAFTMGEGTYVISDIDSNNKYSKNLIACTSLVVVGRQKGSTENISIMTHQSPSSVLSAYYFKFILRDILRQIKSKCEPATIDAVLVGGTSVKKFAEVVGVVGKEVKDAFDINLVVVNGPKIIDTSKLKYGEVLRLADSVYFDNENRRLYLVRPQVNQVLDKVYPDIDIATYEKNNKEK